MSAERHLSFSPKQKIKQNQKQKKSNKKNRDLKKVFVILAVYNSSWERPLVHWIFTIEESSLWPRWTTQAVGFAFVCSGLTFICFIISWGEPVLVLVFSFSSPQSCSPICNSVCLLQVNQSGPSHPGTSVTTAQGMEHP